MSSVAVQQAMAIAARLSQQVGAGAAAAAGGGDGAVLGKRSRWADLTEPNPFTQWAVRGQTRKKVYIPVKEHPDINFMGLLIGPRGSNQKRMQDESGARILIRGRGSQKDDRPNPNPHPDDNDELHVAIVGDNQSQVDAAAKMVEDILFNPEKAMELKQLQLRDVAQMNGTLRDDFTMGESSEQEEKVEIPNGMVGLIIGKGGENIRDLQLRSGCHIQIQKDAEAVPGATTRNVILRGEPDRLEKARSLINEMINDRMRELGGQKGGGARPGEVCLQVPIPDMKVGLVIGSRGVTIKGIQEKTGANIQIPSGADANDPTVRTIQITGVKEAAEAAQNEVYQLLAGGPNTPGAGGGGGVVVYMQIPDDKVGLVIGSRGATIKDIQSRTGARIQIPSESDQGTHPPVRTITLTGVGDAGERAKLEIEHLCAGDRGHGYGGGGRGGGGHGYHDPYGYGGQQQYGMVDPYYAQAGQGMVDPYYAQAGSPTGHQAAAPAADPNDPEAASKIYWDQYHHYVACYGQEAANKAYGWTPEELAAGTAGQGQAAGGAAAAAAAPEAGAPGAPAPAPAPAPAAAPGE